MKTKESLTLFQIPLIEIRYSVKSKEEALLKMNILHIIIFAFVGLFSSEVKADVSWYQFRLWRAEVKREFQGKVIVYNSCNLKLNKEYFQ